MVSKTSQFDKALEVVLKDLKTHKRTCKVCGGGFEVFKDDIAMYHKLRVPPPTFCPRCRLQRRLALMLRLPPFYKKSCSAPAHIEKVISLFPQASPHKVYDNVYWRSDVWDQLAYGREYDSSRPFFEQFQKLFFSFPHQALFVDAHSVNSDYSIGGVSGRNCYYVSSPIRSENIWYSFIPIETRDSMDVSKVDHSEFLYECINCSFSFNCNFCVNSSNCRDSWFLFDCKNCSDCFMSSNLRNKSYYFYNRPLSKEEYYAKLEELNLDSRKTLARYRNEFRKLWKKAVHRALDTRNAADSIGDRMYDCKKCFQAFEAYEDCENLRYVASAVASKDAMDVYGIDHSSMSYESEGVSGSYIFFSGNLRNCSFVEYSQYCRDSDYCFGCVGVRNKKFCILNMQYSEEDYWLIVDTIKTAMLRDGEYGEVFPLQFGLMPYQNTTAHKEFPLTKDELNKKGIPVYEDTESGLPKKIEIVASDAVPDSISQTDDDIFDKAIRCEVTGKPFRIVESELVFYRRKKLPIPVRHPDQRMRERFNMENPFRLWNMKCAKCGRETQTSYDPKQSLTIYCENCYLKEIG